MRCARGTNLLGLPRLVAAVPLRRRALRVAEIRTVRAEAAPAMTSAPAMAEAIRPFALLLAIPEALIDVGRGIRLAAGDEGGQADGAAPVAALRLGRRSLGHKGLGR